jgi:hypothetical protein
MSDICEHFNTHISDYEFCQEVANDGYVSLDLSDYNVEDLAEDIRWQEGKDSDLQERLQNDLALVEYFRNIGYRDSILVYVSW